MTYARPKEGPRAPLFYGALVLAVSALASAQTVDVSALEQCAALDTDAGKLACFEAIVAESRADAVLPADAEPETSDAAVAAEDPADVAQVPTTDAAPVATEAAAVAAAVESAPVPDESSVPGDTFGRDHLERSEQEEADVLRATVTEVTKGRHGALVFHLDNGQTWQQMEPRFYPYPKNREFDVEISTGMMGAYSLQVDGKGRKVAVRRTK